MMVYIHLLAIGTYAKLLYSAVQSESSEMNIFGNTVANRPYLWRLIVLFLLMTQLLGCRDDSQDELVTKPAPWWSTQEPDARVGMDEFYGADCAITRVSSHNGDPAAEVIFKVPYQLLSSCKESGTEALVFDGEYLIFSICHMRIGAGSCVNSRFRTADFVHWQEEIGITWIKGEQYEAWRRLGSTSTKADAVKKIIKRQ
ncbi:hypothetical protein [Shewanella sp.]|uniref:hypothetical protein n=1 Tax=Shewanella sp. TaxID=50422 RepID=UPI004053D01E